MEGEGRSNAGAARIRPYKPFLGAQEHLLRLHGKHPVTLCLTF